MCRCLAIQLVTFSLLAATVPTSAKADVTVVGETRALELTARQSTLKEALERLSVVFGLELHGVDTLNEPVSGSFKGSLSSVVDQLLATQNHFMRPTGAGMALFVMPPKAEPATPTTAAASGTAEQPAADDPVKAQLEKPVTLSPAGQEMAVQMFGEKGRYLQVNETLLQSFFSNRGGRRFIAGAARLPH